MSEEHKPSPIRRYRQWLIPWRAIIPLRRFSPVVVPLGLLALSCVLVLLGQAARLVLQPDMQAELHQADRLFVDGYYYEALHAYTALASHDATPSLDLRLGMVRLMRGEYPDAERALWRVVASDATGDTRSMALLYLGQSFARHDNSEQALRLWSYLEPCPPHAQACFYDGVRQVLQAELAFHQDDYATAEAAYRAALPMQLPAEAQSLVAYRLALLHAAHNPDAALTEWNHLHTSLNTENTTQRSDMQDGLNPLLLPLLPDSDDEATRLLTVLLADAPQRQQLLGQFFIDLQLYGLAEQQFATIAPDSPHALAAASYAAYGRWQADDAVGARMRLSDLVNEYPQNLHVRAMLVLALLAEEEHKAAQEQIDVMIRLAPYHSDTHIAQAAHYIQESEYVSATLKYKQALFSAAEPRQGHYALLAARFHLRMNFSLCNDGIEMADMAVAHMPHHAEAWSVLAASRYHCRDFQGAIGAAETALEHDARAEAAYYLGAAWAALNNAEQARAALIHAANLEPASIWRQRAETMLAEIQRS